MKKLGKILLFGAAVGTAAAATYHYFKKMEKNSESTMEDEDNVFVIEDEDSYFEDEDFDNDLEITAFDEVELDEDATVSVEEFIQDPTPDTDIDDMASTTPEPVFSPLADTLMQEEDVEEFFDEDDEEPTEE